MEECWAQPDDPIEYFFQFCHDTSETLALEELITDHVAANDAWVDRDYFFDSVRLVSDWEFPDTTFESPEDGTTPADYFADEVGWRGAGGPPDPRL